jgi:hypothetical protein
MSESKDTIALNVRLKPSDFSVHLREVNDMNVRIAQGIALVTRVAMDLGALARLQQQIQQVLVGLWTAKPGKPKGQV